MRSWLKALGYALLVVLVVGGYFLSRSGRVDSDTDISASLPPDPGYSARDAEVIETGFDGQERYRLHAKTIRQRSETSAIDVDQLEMEYHPGAQDKLPGEKSRDGGEDVWHLKSDRGQVRAEGDDVELQGNVTVTGPPPGGAGEPLSLTTDTLRINTPTEFVETQAPVKIRWSGHDLDARGMQADLKAGTVRLESDVHGEFSPK